MRLSAEQLSERTLEDLCISIIKLETKIGAIANLQPKDVLQDWIQKQIPSPVGLKEPSRGS